MKIIPFEGNYNPVKKHVLETYENISSDFSRTRYNIWGKNKEFLDMLPKGAIVLDAGCGNGRNSLLYPDLMWISMDACFGLLKDVKDGNNPVRGSLDKLMFKSGLFDAVNCTAVLHHISGEDNRIRVFQGLIDLLRCGGLLYLQVWQKEQDKFSGFETCDVLMSFKNNSDMRYYHLYNKGEFDRLVEGVNGIKVLDLGVDRGNYFIICEKN